MLVQFCIFLLLALRCEAFQRPLQPRQLSITSKNSPLSRTQLYNKPKQTEKDKQTEAAVAVAAEDKGYDIIGSFTRFGLQPALIHIFQNKEIKVQYGTDLVWFGFRSAGSFLSCPSVKFMMPYRMNG